jgi:hypothetical protein
MHDEPALMAEVQTTPLMMEGTTEMPPRTKAMTKGDWAAVPVEMEREGSLDFLCWLEKSQYDVLRCLATPMSFDHKVPHW